MMMGFGTSVFAQVPQTGQEEMGTEYPQEQQQQTLPEDDQEHFRPQEEGVLPQEQSQLGDVDYSEEIEESELPATVTASIEERYPDHDVKKVFRGDDNSYKVKIENGNEKSVVYYDESGSFVKEEQDKDKDRDRDNKW